MTAPVTDGHDGVTPAMDAMSPPGGKPHKKRKNKVRSVWISFVGRIVAQFVGSAATIVLGLMLLHKYQPGTKAAATDDTTARAAATSLTSLTLPAADAPRNDAAVNDGAVAETLSLAVLPMSGFTSARDQHHLAEAMTDVLTSQLAKVPGLRVVSRTSATNVRTDQKLSHIAASLGVRYVVEGSVTESDGRVRIIARLIDAARDEHVWTGRYERPARATLAMEDEVAETIARDVQSALGDGGEDGATAIHGRLSIADSVPTATTDVRALHATR